MHGILYKLIASQEQHVYVLTMQNAPTKCCLAAIGQSQTVTYTAPFTFPWLESDTSQSLAGVTFTAGKDGEFRHFNAQCLSYPWCMN